MRTTMATTQRAESADGLGLTAAEERGHQADPDEVLGDGDVEQRPAQHRPPQAGAPQLELLQGDEGVGHAQGRAPSGHVDDHGHRQDVDGQAHLALERPGGGRVPGLDDAPTGRQGRRWRPGRPRWGAGHQAEVAEQDEHDPAPAGRPRSPGPAGTGSSTPPARSPGHGAVLGEVISTEGTARSDPRPQSGLIPTRGYRQRSGRT